MVPRGLGGLVLCSVGCTLLVDLDEGLVRGPEMCTDGIDNDGNGDVDCADASCEPHPACEVGAIACGDGVDNDIDGFVDCRDEDCRGVCVERGASCSDGRDNDQDFFPDCADTDCSTTPGCFLRANLIDQQPCEATRSGFALADTFGAGGLDLSKWIRRGETFISNGYLQLPFEESGIMSVEEFHIGAGQPFSLEVELAPASDCEVPAQPVGFACGGFIGFLARTSTTSLAPMQSILGLFVGSSAQTPNRYDLRCEYHGRLSDPVLWEVSDPAQAFTLSARLDPDSGEARFFVDRDLEVCSLPIADEEPEVRFAALAIHRPAPRPIGLQIGSVDLRVDRQTRQRHCSGIFPDPPCSPGDSGFSALFDPRVARGPGGYRMLFGTLFLPARGSHSAWQSSSPDGSWSTWSSPSSFPLESDALPQIGAIVYRPDLDRFEAWIGVTVDSMTRLDRYSSLGMSSDWTKLGTATLVGAHRDQLVTAVVFGDGMYRAWYSDRDRDGRFSIFTATSTDGETFVSEPAPVLTSGAPGAWDAEGVFDPSVFRGDRFFVMAYNAQPLFGRLQVGLAVSEDGITWERHPSNPVLRADNVELDDFSVRYPSVGVDEQVVSLWYGALGGSFLCDREFLVDRLALRRLAIAPVR